MNTILHSFAYTLDFLRDLLADVSPADMVAQPPGTANHPAWLVGHLTFSCQELGGVVGLTPWLPKIWALQFGPGSTPVADVKVYEPKTLLLDRLRDAQTRIATAVAALDDEALDSIFPEVTLRNVFPTVRHALTQVLLGHTSYHVGQLAVWRKAAGLPTLGRSFQ